MTCFVLISKIILFTNFVAYGALGVENIVLINSGRLLILLQLQSYEL